ncbi:MAG: Hsp20/alpha crystallin family protein [Candidatus Omnitrophota bacterium]|jgi:HSP20 family protein|nr:MAG: Hsp20/alpha crystallin family protein [Candidatus Omnitrophota bacterium]
MALIPWRPRETWWDPFRDLEVIQNEMNRMFNSSLVRWGDRDVGLLEGAWSPAIDIYDSKDNIMVKADIPGMKKDEIEVSVHGDTLIIKGEKKQEKEVKEKDYVRTERFYGSFNRAISLPAAVDASKVNASYKNGVLELVLPKKEEAKPKQLKVDIK